MSSVVVALLHTLRTSVRTRAALEAEILALRHQLHVLQRSRPRQLRLTRADREITARKRSTLRVSECAANIAWLVVGVAVNCSQ